MAGSDRIRRRSPRTRVGARGVGAGTAAGGQRLATGTFVNETASGWQELRFTNPVTLTAGTAYTASYHTADGTYVSKGGAFTQTGLSAGPLTAPAGQNGVYVCGVGAFPTSNVWADGPSAGQPVTP